ncbi:MULTISPECIES: dockerin type I repeat-containing protein [unclassified Breznakia]|uniref:dockerin type I repeat-containing protein n=1 Tax=unclassified Breznakia TaxID=2623764 RepID=UPI002406A1B4|nr:MULTISPECIES: dockerin type I repeat-containing protein [unclassified Breznakia]MDF9838264.1 hypothetical protein [Breznakia sp. PFB2-8]MDF9860297.1 hypothetical protein [Breznakia sp. PH5-24]
MKKISLLTVFKKIFLVCMIMFISLSAISIPQSIHANEEASETEINEETQTELEESKEENIVNPQATNIETRSGYQVVMNEGGNSAILGIGWDPYMAHITIDHLCSAPDVKTMEDIIIKMYNIKVLYNGVETNIRPNLKFYWYQYGNVIKFPVTVYEMSTTEYYNRYFDTANRYRIWITAEYGGSQAGADKNDLSNGKVASYFIPNLHALGAEIGPVNGRWYGWYYEKEINITAQEAMKLNNADELMRLAKWKTKIKNVDTTASMNSRVNISNTDWIDIKAGKNGTYSFKIAHNPPAKGGGVSYNETYLIKVNVVGEVATLNASNGTMSDTQAKALGNINNLKSYNNVSASLNGVNKINEVSVSTSNNSAILAGTPGTYNVTYSYGGQSKTVTITITKSNVITLNAINGTLTSSQAKALGVLSNLKPYNQVSASLNGNNVTSSVNVSSTSASAILSGVVGTYSVTYTYGGQSKTVSITVSKDPDVITLNAINGTLTSSQAKALGVLSNLKSYNQVSASLNGNNVTSSVNVSSTSASAILSGIVGTYSVTYTYGGQSKTVNITVVADPDVIVLNASDGSISVSEVKKYVSLGSLRKYNNVKATLNGTIVTGQVTATSPNEIDILLGKLGTYPITYSYGGQSKTVNITVVADPDVITLNAINGTLTSSQAKALGVLSNLKPYNQVSASLNGNNVTSSVNVSSTSTSAILSGIVGTYSVTYTYGGQSKTVNITVVADPDVIVLNASDGSISVSEVKKYVSLDSLRKYNNVKATLNGTIVTGQVTATSPNEIDILLGKLGTYPITYSYGGQSKTVNITVVADPDVITLNAINGTLTSSQAKALGVLSNLKPYNQVSASLNGNDVTSSVNVSSTSTSAILSGIVGTYSVTYTYGGQSKTVSITVSKDPDVIVLNASDGTMSDTQAKALGNLSNLKPYNGVIARLNGVDKTGEVNVSASSSVAILSGTPGTYSVTYSYGGQSKTVSITITKSEEIIVISAKDAVITQSEAQALKDEQALLAYNDARASVNGTSVTPIATVASWSAIKAGILGTYKVEYSYKGQSKTVNVRVVEDGGVIPPDRSFVIYANTAVMHAKEAKQLTNRNELISVHQARVELANGGSGQPSVSVLTASKDKEAWGEVTQGKVGLYAVIFGYGSGSNQETKEVGLFVIEIAVSVEAQDGIMSPSEAQALADLNGVKIYNKVTAKEGSIDKTSEVSASSPYESMILAGVEGTYPITYTYGNVSRGVKITIKDGKISPDRKFVVSAKNKVITQEQARALNVKEDLIAYNEAAVTFADGTTTDPVVRAPEFALIQSGNSLEKPHMNYYSYGSGANAVEVAASVTVVKGQISPDEDFILKAQDALMSQSEAKALLGKQELLQINKAEVVFTDGSGSTVPNVDILTSKWTELNNGVVGVYEVTYSYGNGNNYTQKKVKVTVCPDGSEISPERTFAVYAKDAVITQSEAKGIANENGLIRYNAAMVYFGDGTTTNPSVTTSELAKIKAGTLGSYNVKYSYVEDGVSVAKDVKVTVVKDGAQIGPERDLAIYAEDATLSVDEAKGLNVKEDLITKCKAEVYYADGRKGIPDVVASKFTTIKNGTEGKYDVSFEKGSVSKDVVVSVSVDYYEAYLFDYNGNGVVDSYDNAMFNNYLMGNIAMTPEALLLSDANGNGMIDSYDSARLSYFLMNPQVTPPIVRIPK